MVVSLSTTPISSTRIHSELSVDSRTAAARIGPIARHRTLPLSFAQQRLWLSDQMNPSVPHHITAGLRLHGRLHRQSLRAALDRIVARHEVLRTKFRSVEGEGEPVQVIGPADSGFSLIEQDVTGGSDVEQISQQEAREPFDLSSGPLVRGRLLRLSDQEHVLLITQHRIICDDWSIGVLLREMSALYCAYALGNGDPLPPLELQYADYATWQRQQVTAEILGGQLELWRQNLSDAREILQLPTDWPHPAVPYYSADRVQVSLSAGLTERLRELAQQQGITLFATLLSSWAVLLGRWSGQEEVLIGTRLANRGRPEIEPLIGAFERTAALRVRLQESTTLEQLLLHAGTTVTQACSHQDVPFEQVTEAIESAHSHVSQFQVMIILNETPATIGPSADQQLLGVKFSEVPIESARTQLELSLSLSDGEDGLTGTLEYASNLFERETIDRMAACWKVLLDAMVSDVQQPISQLPMLAAAEREKVVNEFNATELAYPRDRLMHELFEDQVQRRHGAVAVAYEGRQLTYGELNNRANQLAHYLREQGVRPEGLVGICVERSLEMVVGLLGILKAGGAYVPLDPSYPAKRVEYMLADSAPVVLLTQERLKKSLPATDARVIALDSDWEEISQRPGGNPDVGPLTPQHLAYVIYTSGSTGTPKGVMVEHRSVARFLASSDDWFHFSQHDTWTLFHSFAFDFSVLELWGSLLYGGRLVIVPYEVTRAPGEFYELLCREGITVLNQTPSAFRQLMAAQAKSAQSHVLQTVILGGEALEVSLLESWYERHAGHRPQVTNMYGPTETTVFVTFRPIESADTLRHAGGSPIGSPIPHSRIYVLDKHCQPVPIGVTGEIYIGGAGVARGYLNRPELTAERFSPDPFCADPGARMYKTGDLGRWRCDGGIEYLGRNDHQVKIRGFRIELGEVEGQLVRHPQVKEAVVVVREDVPGEKRLVAYVTRRDENGPGAKELREHLKAMLPEYMVPSAFVALDSLPLTPNGKLDRRSLPAPELGAYVSREYEAPQGANEETLARIWQELLRVERVGRRDNFFELGGHSLQIVQMMERLRQVGVSVEMRDVFESRTLADLAKAPVGEAVGQFEVPTNLIPAECEAITPQMLPLVELGTEQIERIVRVVPGGAANVKDIYPLTPLQEGMLFHHLLDEQGGDTYVMPTLLSVSSRERLDELITAIQQVIDRHDILRTAVLWEGLPDSVQVVYRHAKLPVEELVLDRALSLTEQIEEWVKPERQRLALWQAPLMRLQVAADVHDGQWYALLQIHHIVDDAVSLKILISEVVAHLGGRAKELPEPVPYRNHVAQALVRARTHDAEAFFRSRLEEIDEPTAPFGLLDVHGDGSRIEEACQEFEPALAQRVRVQARRLSVSVATLFHAAWGLVVARTSGRDDVVFGSVLLGRLQGSAGAQRIMGMFVNTLPLRLRLQDVTAEELVEQTRRELVELLTHEQASLAMAQRCSGIARSSPLFTAVLNYRHSVPDPEAEWASAAGIRVLAYQYRTNYPIGLSVDDLGDGFALTAQTERRVDPHRFIGYMQTAMQSLVEALERAPHTPALALSILPESERQQVTKSFNATQAEYPQEKLIHQLFEEQVERTPSKMAVVHEEQSLTYAELNSRANQLARHLIDKGIGPDRLVALCVDRSVEMLVGLLGVLKAGGAYLPLDPTNPAERLEHVLTDAEPQVVLTQERLKGMLPRTTAEVIVLDTEWGEIAKKREENLDPHSLRLTAKNLAYVIYTSGSTGKPKGVMIEHRNIVNYAVHALSQFDVSSGGGTLICTSISFDLMLTGLYPTLLGGRTVRLCRDQQGMPALADELLRSSNLAPLKLTPSHLALLEDALRSGQLAGRVRVLVLGGEQLHESAVHLWRKYAPGTRIFNHYGPTETTVGCVVHEIGESVSGAVPIGRPIANVQIYILDRHLQPVPIGVAGEIYIGGAGVARGYLNRPELTAERFVVDQFSQDPQARLYKSGDLGRWRVDGTIECLGRNDHQVKVRGYRVELGEIEAQLARHAQVKEAVVVAREDVPGEKRLVAYLVAESPQFNALSQEGLAQAGAEMVAQWRGVHDETYSGGPSGPSFVGWNSSYTGQPIPETQMREWLACTVDRIQAVRPTKVLEIGCGAGLVLQQLAPECASYLGTDISAVGLDQLRQWVSGQSDLKHVELLHRSATELQDLQAGSFDTVVLNSVVQYFPDIDYLMTVLQQAVRLLGPGGRIFVGDVRHLGLLRMFHSVVQLSKAAATVNMGQLRNRISRAMAQDKELVIDPQFFLMLPGRVPGISRVELQMKRGRAPNELTRYRYDVVLHTGEQLGRCAVCEPLEWQSAVGSVAELEKKLAERHWGAVRLRSIPNLRLAGEAAAQRLIETSDERLEASALRRQLKDLQFDGVDPEKIWELGRAHGYDTTVCWDVHDSSGSFEVQLLDGLRADRVPLAVSPPSDAVKPWRAYANDPLETGFRQQLIPQLREYLKSCLPEYMIPSAWVIQKQLPLTPNGKVDRRALPPPQGRPEELGDYVAPRTALESTLASIWAQVLQVDQVGVQDNFFEIGGHSIVAMQVVVRIRSLLSIEMPMRLLFEFPTVEQLSAQVDDLRQVRLLDSIADGGIDIEELLEKVTSLPESKVQELVRELRKDGRP